MAESRADFIEQRSRLRVCGRSGYQLDFQQSRMTTCEVFNDDGEIARAEQDNLPARFGIMHQRREYALGIRSDASMLRGNIAQPKSDPHDPVSGV